MRDTLKGGAEIVTGIIAVRVISRDSITFLLIL